MKTRIATVISVVGVLAAGTAAAMVNTQIFESQPTVSDESSAMLAPQPTTVGLSLDSTSTSTTAGDIAGSGSLTEFVVGDAGVVTVDVIDGELRIVSARAADGWMISEQEEKLDENRVEVYFTSGSVTVEFDADYINGVIVPDIDTEQRSVAPPVTGGTQATAPTTAPEPAGASTTIDTAPSPSSTAPTSFDDDEYEDHDDDEYEDHDEDDDEYEDHDEDHDDD